MILYVLSGLPGAGKTTRAREIVGQTNAILLCRDELRVSYSNLKDEGHLTAVMAEQARFFLRQGYDVVVDSWNLTEWDEELWNGVASSTAADLHWEHLQVDTELCVIRDAGRPQPIGADCVRGAADEFYDRLRILAGMPRLSA